MAPTCTACHHLGLTSAPEEVRSQTVSFMLLLNLRVCGELCMAPCFNGPTLMPFQPSSWYRETGCWYSWDISNPRLCLLLSEARTSFVSMRMHPARHAPTLSEECGAYERIPMAGPRETIARLLNTNFVPYKVDSRRGLRRSFAGQPDLGFYRCRCDGTLTAGCGGQCVGASMR